MEFDLIGLTKTETDEWNEIQIPASVTFMKYRRKFTNTRSSGTIIAVRDNIVKCVRIINTNCKLSFNLKSVYRLIIWPTLSLTFNFRS